MMLVLYTAQYAIRDRDWTDITRAGCDRARAAGTPSPGEFLAPSGGLVFPFIGALRAITAVESALPVPRWAEEARAALWARYEVAFRLEMLASYGTCRLRGPDRARWEELLARPRAVLACFCIDSARCHRTLVAHYLGKLGADYRGELRAEDAILIGAEKPPAILFGPERPCQKFLFTDGSGGGIVCRGRGRWKKLPPCATCGRPAALLCDAPALNNALTCDAPICRSCARTVGEDEHHCPKHAAQEAHAG